MDYKFFDVNFPIASQHRTLGDPAEVGEGEPSGNRLAGTGELSGGPHPQQPASPAVDNVVSGSSSSSIAPKTTGGTAISVARPPDGLLRNIKEEVVVSREETKERTEVTEQKHFGDFSDDVSMRDPAPTSGSVWKHFKLGRVLKWLASNFRAPSSCLALPKPYAGSGANDWPN